AGVSWYEQVQSGDSPEIAQGLPYKGKSMRNRDVSPPMPFLLIPRSLLRGGFILPGYVGFFQFLRNFRQQNAFEQAELILRAALDSTMTGRAKKGGFVKCFDHFDLLQSAIN